MIEINQDTIFENNGEILDCNSLSYSVRYNGYMGGDSGHGGFMEIVIKNNYETCWEAIIIGSENCPDGIAIRLEGDSEKETFIKVLENIVKDFKSNIKKQEKYLSSK